MNILQINSSARAFANGQGSQSTRLANELVETLRAGAADATLALRDLTANPHPALDEATLGALFTPAEARTPEQHARVALDQALIDEVHAADVIVIGVPMINFGISSQLKNWIDAIAKAGITFKYTATGPVGLIEGKKVYAVLTRGGIYRDQPHDTQVPYLRQTLGFLGIKDIEFIYAEGLNMGPEAADKGIASAREHIARIADGAAVAA
ncbi:MAG: NAD(P)H-dependent oxidoreductase [Burkholderiales bacterium]|jgi:FMN-dependent NADH-azoreductase|nr:NAD(P)H-dependent oxidoreductase [Burkholderiales bacterium]